MVTLKMQLKLLKLELERPDLSKKRLLEIKDFTKTLARQIDVQCGVGSAAGMVEDLYRKETKYPKRRIKKVVQLLLECA